MLRIGVCDDDKEFLQRLVQMIHIWSDHSGIPTELYPFDNGDELISKNAAFRMDIILLDIVMPLLNGMDTARELRFLGMTEEELIAVIRSCMEREEEKHD